MLQGALCGALIALVIYIVTYAQAANDRELCGETEAVIRLNPLPAVLILVVCVVVGALIGVKVNG